MTYEEGSTTRGARSAAPSTRIRQAARVTAVVFLLVGVLGFIPGVTSDYDTLGLAGADSHAMLLGLFQVSILHNIVHLLYGIVGLLMARTNSSAFGYFIGGGLIYLVLWLYGLFIGHDSAANFVPLNTADDWLHLGLAIVMIGAGLLLRRRGEATS